MPPPIQYLPGQGKIVLPPANPKDKKPYVFQAYPSFRFHADGREVVVANEADEMERCPESAGWKTTPFPPKPKIVPPPERTPAQWKAEFEKRSHEFADLQVEHEKLVAYSAEQTAEIQELRKQFAEAGANGSEAGEDTPETPEKPGRKKRS